MFNTPRTAALTVAWNAKGRQMRADSELKEIARGIFTGYITTHMDCVKPADIPMMFMPMLFMEKEEIAARKLAGHNYFFEYDSKQLARQINSRPCFMSMQFAVKEEWQKIEGFYKQFQAAEAKIMKPGILERITNYFKGE